MSLRAVFHVFFCILFFIALAGREPLAQTPAQSSSSSSKSKQSRKPSTRTDSPSDLGTVSNGVYRNVAFGFTCQIPAGWVLRTEEMNSRDDENAGAGPALDSGKDGRVLLAAFSRPPAARGEGVNGSILIAVESAASYPGLKDAAQYFGPVVEVAKAQGFEMEDDPYEFVLGTKKLARGDFQKDVGSRVMRQSTLVLLARGYVVSFTFIGGSEDEVEELVQGLSLVASAKSAK
jgi:hypothetical protein